MVQGFENFDFPNRRNGETIFFLLGIDALERDNFIRPLVLTDKDAAVRAFTDLMLFGKDIDIAQHDGRANGNAANASQTLVWR